MRLLPLLFVLVLSACIPGGPGKGGKPAGADNPITGGAIAVTTLGDVPEGTAPATTSLSRPKSRPGASAAKPDLAQPAPQAAETEPPAEPAVAAPAIAAPAVAEPPPKPKSAAEKTCLKQGGIWGPAGKAGESCRMMTKDSGKHCDAESDCEGYCLARSGTCAPFRPMFGCNEILQDNGVQVTLCLD